MAKIHLRANHLTGTNTPKAVCAMRTTHGDKLKTNNRKTYRFMASEIVGFKDYKNTPAEKRCAHCEACIPAFNKKRIELGLNVWDMSDAAL